jgi:CDGSH-type Zn-finger protein/uncharacterized Fe-S cluster protein YjdI
MADKIVRNYTGSNVTVTWDSKLCIHVGECGRAKGDLFEAGRKPWCNPDVSSDEEVLDVVTRCPSGSLSLVFKDSSRRETPAAENTITVIYGGPLVVKGELEIDGAPDDAPGLKFRASLCRCGQSRNKPYCDNSHAKSDFMDYGAVGETGKPLEQTGGPLKITVMENGPLRLSGNMRIVSGSGRSAWQGTGTALCRCGMSKNKPFCDGTHRAQQWQAD